MQTFQDIGLKLNSSITILKQKITQTESTTGVKKTQTIFFPKKRQNKFTFGCYLIKNLPVDWVEGCFPLPYLLHTLKLFS